MTELGRGEVTTVLIKKEATYGTAVTVTRDIGLVQNVTATLNQNPTENYGLGSSALQDLDWGTVDIGIRTSIGFQHGRLLYFATGGTVTHSASTNDYKHTYTLSDTIPSFTMENGLNMATDAVATYNGCKVSQLTISVDGPNSDIMISADINAKGVTTSTAVTAAVINTGVKLKGWQSTLSTGVISSEATLGNVQRFEFTINNANAGDMRNFNLGSRTANTADVMGRKMTFKFTVAVANMNEYKRFLSGSAASGTTPTDTGASPTLYGLVFNAHNNIAAGSGRVEIKIDVSNVLYSSISEPIQYGQYVFFEVEGTAKTLDDFFTYDQIATANFGDTD